MSPLKIDNTEVHAPTVLQYSGRQDQGDTRRS